MEIISKQEQNREMYMVYPTDYLQIIIHQCVKRLVSLLENYFIFIDNPVRYSQSRYDKVSSFENVCQFFAFFDCMTYLSSRFHQVLKITQWELWLDSMSSLSNLWFIQSTRTALTCLQQCESLLAYNLITPREAVQFLSLFGGKAIDESISKNPHSQKCLVEGRRWYEDVRQLYLEWRSLSLTEIQEYKDTTEVKKEEDPLMMKDKLMELYQKLNLLCLSIYYCHHFQFITQAKPMEKAWNQYGKEKNKYMKEKTLFRIHQQVESQHSRKG